MGICNSCCCCCGEDPEAPDSQRGRKKITSTKDYGSRHQHESYTEKQLNKCIKENKDLKDSLQKHTRETDVQLKKCRQENDEQKDSFRRKILDLEQENDELKTRLSAIIGARITDGNPDIADLSDANRPTNLSNQYSELYDNQWTDAYDELQSKEGMDNTDICIFLCKIFCEIYKLCRQKADDDLERLRYVLKTFYGAENKETMKQFKDKRKALYKHGVDEMKGEIGKVMAELIKKESMLRYKKLKLFIDESLTIGWLMAIQDPPVFVDTDITTKGARFDTNVFKSYTVAGAEIDFVVWPAVYIVEGGALLGKGVAQGRKTEPVIENKDTTHVQKGSSHIGQIDPNEITVKINQDQLKNSRDRTSGQIIPDDQSNRQNIQDKSTYQNIPSTNTGSNVPEQDEQIPQKQTGKTKYNDWHQNVKDDKKTELQIRPVKHELSSGQGAYHTSITVISLQRL